MILRSILPWSLPLFLSACAANMPVRTGYDRATGTWKKARTASSVRRNIVSPPVDSLARTGDSAVADTAGRLPAGTVIKGQASFYGKEREGNQTASGEVFDPDALTCAHRTLPFGTRLKVTYPKKGTDVLVRVNDRGPSKPERILDLSRGAADNLGLTADGVGPVEAEVLP